jgi:hypothetical protein
MQPCVITITACNRCDHAHFRSGTAEGACSSETSVTSYRTTRPRIEEGRDFCFRVSEHIILYSVIILPFKYNGLSEDFIL